MLTPEQIKYRVPKRFWKKIKFGAVNECWEWQASKSANGYAQYSLTTSKPTRAHRYLYMVLFGNLTRWQLVCHSCDNPSCVNPNHLFMGTPQQNVDDMISKGRQVIGKNLPKGSSNHLAKLTESNIPIIRNRLFQGDKLKVIAKDYGVSLTSIWQIKHSITWKHVV